MGLGRTEGAGPDEVASAADLLAVATAAGRPVCAGDRGCGGHDQGADARLAAGVRSRAIERGCTTAEVLEQLSAVPGWHSLATQLAISAQAGTPAAPALRQLASQERLVARRVRERRARRLPVLLLLPLVALVLPAFLLVTVVPSSRPAASHWSFPDRGRARRGSVRAASGPAGALRPGRGTMTNELRCAAVRCERSDSERAQSTVEYALVLLGPQRWRCCWSRG
ncbi:MAG: type II secretion system F family protein [Microthrixaceae bacterium]